MSRPSIAIAHDYLTQRGGAERVVLSLARAFPDAPIYTTLFNPATTYPDFATRNIITSGLNKVSAFRRDHRLALPLLAWASNSLRIDADLVIASSTGWAHGFPTTGKRLVYCHSPARYLYLTDQYLGGPPWRSPLGLGLLALRAPLKAWDANAAHLADKYLCNSSVVRERIASVYGLEADVVPPPAGVRADGPQAPLESLADWTDTGWYLIVSRLLPYKNVQQVIEAFRGLDARLLVVGSGPQGDHLRANLPANVRMVSGISDAALRWSYAMSRGLIAPSFEDFGLAPLEAGAFGKPCLALRAGGYLDTVHEGLSGSFFDLPTPDAIRHGVLHGQATPWNPEAIRAHAERFSEARFIQRIRAEVSKLLGRSL